jgi:hypothetical protein
MTTPDDAASENAASYRRDEPTETVRGPYEVGTGRLL